MSSATTAINMLRDATKYAAEIKKLERVERSAATAVEAAKIKANGIIAKANEVLRKAEAKMDEAEAILTTAKVESAGVETAYAAAADDTLKARAHEKKLLKGDDRLAQDRSILKRDQDAHGKVVADQVKRAEAFEIAAAAACKLVTG